MMGRLGVVQVLVLVNLNSSAVQLASFLRHQIVDRAIRISVFDGSHQQDIEQVYVHCSQYTTRCVLITRYKLPLCHSDCLVVAVENDANHWTLPSEVELSFFTSIIEYEHLMRRPWFSWKVLLQATCVPDSRSRTNGSINYLVYNHDGTHIDHSIEQEMVFTFQAFCDSNAHGDSAGRIVSCSIEHFQERTYTEMPR
jgi:hypothetical protein